MSTPLPPLRTSRELVESARARAATSMPTESYQSYPIPGEARGARRVTFLHGISRLEFGSGLYLIAPSFRIDLDAATGGVLDATPIAPSDLGVADEPGKTLGRFGLPKGVSPEDYVKAREALLDAYDRLLGPWYAGEVPPETGRSSRAAAPEMKRVFAVVGEPPLAPYYAAVGRAFFAWVNELASLS
jgi:hypothetical protein